MNKVTTMVFINGVIIKMKLITFKDIENLNISPTTCFKWASDMIEYKKEICLPAKISMKPRDGAFINVMPVIIGNMKKQSYGGVKIVTRYPGREPSLDSQILLLDANTGDSLALMDGDWITTMRTGAVAVHSIKLLAKKDFKTMGIMGLGNTVRAMLLILLEIFKDRQFTIKLLRYKNQAELFIDRFKGYSNVDFIIVDDIKTLVKGSDVVVSGVTYLDNDVCPDEYFDEGVLLVPIHTRGFSNCDLFFDKVYVDDVGHVEGFKNFAKFKFCSEVADVVNGKNIGRENDKERIVAYNVGVAMHDIYFASKLYEKLQNTTKDIDLLKPKEKFWV